MKHLSSISDIEKILIFPGIDERFVTKFVVFGKCPNVGINSLSSKQMLFLKIFEPMKRVLECET